MLYTSACNPAQLCGDSLDVVSVLAVGSATVLERLRIYEQETAPILRHYTENASLLEVDGEQPKENIAQEIVMAIQSMLRTSIAGAKNVQSTLEDNL